MYWGASVEAQAPFTFLPKDAGLKGAVFADAGSLWDYKGPTTWDVTGEKLVPARLQRDPRLGRRRPDLEFAVWSVALRLLVPAHEAGLRSDPGSSASAAARNSRRAQSRTNSIVE